MPTYEYNCPKCGIFEEFHKMSDRLTHCPVCGQEVTRLISPNQNIIFKGSGFHTTDYRSGDYQKKAASENPGAGEKAGASTTASSGTADKKSTQTESKAS